jgi:hypothetical protein
VQFPGAFPLNSLTNATLEFYVKPTGTGSQMFFLWTRTDSTDANRFNMGVINGNSIGFDYREPNGTWHIIFPGGGPLQIPSTGWSHVAVVKSGNVWTGYINGVQMGQPVTDANPNLPTNTGWTLNGSNIGQFAGLLDEFRISNSALTPSQFLPPVTGGTTCTYSLSPSGASPGATQTTGSITVTAGTGCAWTATSNATSWITITSGASGSGNGTVSYTVAANTGTTSRTGTITVGGQTFTVTQAAAAACSYSITPSTNTMGAQGGSGSFVVTTGSTCSWTASVSSSALVAASGLDHFRHGDWNGGLLGRCEYLDCLAHRHHHRGRTDVHPDRGRRRLGHRAEHQPGRHCERGQQPGRRRHRARLHVQHLRDQPGTGRVLDGLPIPDPRHSE